MASRRERGGRAQLTSGPRRGRTVPQRSCPDVLHLVPPRGTNLGGLTTRSSSSLVAATPPWPPTGHPARHSRGFRPAPSRRASSLHPRKEPGSAARALMWHSAAAAGPGGARDREGLLRTPTLPLPWPPLYPCF